jgi:hypothetical protein
VGRIVQVSKRPILPLKNATIFAEGPKMVHIGINCGKSVQVCIFSDTLLFVCYLLIQQTKCYPWSVLVLIVSYNIVSHATSIVNTLFGTLIGFPGISRLHIDVILGLSHHLIIKPLKGSLNSRRVKAYIIGFISREDVCCVLSSIQNASTANLA